jgi:hypothetical protein
LKASIVDQLVVKVDVDGIHSIPHLVYNRLKTSTLVMDAGEQMF